MGTVQLTVHARTDVGRVRTHNEDAFAVCDLASGAALATPVASLDVREKGVLMVVADGMGGHAAGEVASALVVESLRKALSELPSDHGPLQRLLDAAVRRVNQEVFRKAQSVERKGMGATLTAVLVHDAEAWVAEVGDSRAYLLRGGTLRQVTKDQSYVQVLLDAGVLTPEQARTSPQKNIILQAMGLEESVTVSLGRIALRRGDRFLLCSDGLWGKLDDAELRDQLADERLAGAPARMVDLANERGAEDNVTVVVAEVGGDGAPALGAGEAGAPPVEVLQEYGVPQKAAEEPAPARPVPAKAPARAPAPPPQAPPAAAPAPQPAAPPTWATRELVVVGLVVAIAALALWWAR